MATKGATIDDRSSSDFIQTWGGLKTRDIADFNDDTPDSAEALTKTTWKTKDGKTFTETTKNIDFSASGKTKREDKTKEASPTRNGNSPTKGEPGETAAQKREREKQERELK